MVALNAEIEKRAQAVANVLARFGTVRAIYLFGSQAEGRAHPWSDIDLAAFMDGVEIWDIRQRAKVMATIMQEVGAEVETHLLSASALDNPDPASLAAYILHNGTRVG